MSNLGNKTVSYSKLYKLFGVSKFRLTTQSWGGSVPHLIASIVQFVDGLFILELTIPTLWATNFIIEAFDLFLMRIIKMGWKPKHTNFRYQMM